jgi:hypothetical protein
LKRIDASLESKRFEKREKTQGEKGEKGAKAQGTPE